MYNQNKSFDEIYDFYALRVIVDTELECYTVLGIIHEMFNSIPGRFKDYISTPKPNMYRSLHTTVIGRDGIPFEVQIRTREMHHIAEYGVAAHWKYKSGESSKEDIDKKLEWIAHLIETEEGARDPDEFLQAIRTDIFHDETFVFTPKGDVIALPQGATVIDFAYAIHSAVGNRMVGAKINGMIVPIDRVPQNGEIVEILTTATAKGPSRDWLKIVKTGSARSKIRAWFKKELKDDNMQAGRAMIDAEFRKYSVPVTEVQREQIMEAIAQRFGYMGPDDLYNALGYGGIPITKISLKLHDEYRRVVRPEPEEQETITKAEQVVVNKPPRNISSGSGVVVDGERGCQVKFAKCCNPLPGDDIIGFITKGFGISVHKKDCPNVAQNREKEENAERWVAVEWENAAQTAHHEMYEAMLQIHAFQSLKLIANLTSALADMRVAILQINTQTKDDDRIVINLKVSCKNVEHYRSIVSRLSSLEDVQRITRGFA
jgi:GTP pyrophosphokinase